MTAKTHTGHKTEASGKDNPVSEAFRPIRSTFWAVGVFSFLINILMLTGPIFMLQVYDRVLASGSVPTLVVIGGLAIVLYAFYGLLEGLRGRILSRIGQRVDARLSPLVYRLSMLLPTRLGRHAAKIRPVQDLDAVRQFLSGPGPAAIFDLPWLPLYLGIVFLFHPILGFVGLGGAVIICILIALNEVMSRAPVQKANQQAGRRMGYVETGQRNSEVISAMGMDVALTEKWDNQNTDYLDTQRHAADRSGFFGTTIKTIRFVLQSAILGVGAWLAILGEITPGVMIASSIMTSRALAPIEQAVAQWRGFVACRQALARLRQLLGQAGDIFSSDTFELPLPSKEISVEQLSCGPLGEHAPFVNNINFKLEAGDGLGVIGPSGSGKSTLARALVGISPSLRGAVRYDGAEISQYTSQRRGQFVGYLPQDLQLFDGTIADNIARFREDKSTEAIIEAAELADVHKLIVTLPEGYNTVIGSAGRSLSAGQRQRIALARALYGDPFLIVLDEPNSNLDAEGEASLTAAIKEMRDKGAIVVVIAHRPSAIATVDKILCLSEGNMAAFGPKDEALKQVVKPVPRKMGGIV
ncbi:alkaline protease secretion ATP-binding protein AprD [Roseibium sp. TrichSKD4]|uniref:type I secretion system permease/ATPase n=1 Tax=Roseibium sp. TrichSKD4 TaxID=744980 RepID=UPI0001E56134|nr:type I secretion system permease/ATPase [Roseibium sp. TrichSKD4]EFO33694.1 alkaline protease secretion ATP-binding protein AprD [Roseibium sp. TrichSKD4]